MAKGLSREICHARTTRIWKGIILEIGNEAYTHNLFADDTLLFDEASMNESHNIKQFIDDYSLASSQLINPAKSNIFF